MLIGYARVTTQAENSDLIRQQEVLQHAGCKKIFTDVRSGIGSPNPGLLQCFFAMSEGDTIVVCNLACIGRTAFSLIGLIHVLGERNIGIRSLEEGIETSSPESKCILRTFSTLLDVERAIKCERARVNMRASRAKGQQRLGGRKAALNAEGVERARALHQSKEMTVAEICKTLGVSRTTFYRSLASTASE